MSLLEPRDNFSVLEAAWRDSGPATNEALNGRWRAAMQTQTNLQSLGEANRFYWGIAAALVLGWHLALVAGWSSSLACGQVSSDERAAAGLAPLAWHDLLTDLEGGDVPRLARPL